MIIGITGSFGTGKTTVANMFKQYGFEVINVDKLYHGIYNKNKLLKKQIKKEFGTLDRNKIKKIVFKDANKLKKLNEITHPLIIDEIKKEIITIINSSNKKIPIIKKNNNKESIIKKYNIKKTIKNNGENSIGNKNNVKIMIDAPLLLEAKATNLVDKIIVVKCNKKKSIKRALKKGRHTKTDIENIIKSQMPLKEKINYADFIVDNSKTIKETEKQVKKIIGVL